MVSRYLNPQLVDSFNTSLEEAFRHYRSDTVTRILRMAATQGSGAVGWQLGDFITEWTGYEDNLIVEATITGVTTASFALFVTIYFNYRDFLSKSNHDAEATSLLGHRPSPLAFFCSQNFYKFLKNNWRDIVTNFIASAITDGLWQVYYNMLVCPMTNVDCNSNERTPLWNMIPAFLLAFGVITTATSEVLYKSLGFVASDSGSASFEKSLVAAMGGAFVFAIVGEVEKRFDDLPKAALIPILLALAGLVVAIGTAATGTMTTGFYCLYDRCFLPKNTSPESHDKPRLEPSLAEEILFRLVGKRPETLVSTLRI